MYECHPPFDDGHPSRVCETYRAEDFAAYPLPQAGWAAALLLAGFGAFVLGLNQTSADAVVLSAALCVAAALTGLMTWLFGDRN